MKVMMLLACIAIVVCMTIPKLFIEEHECAKIRNELISKIEAAANMELVKNGSTNRIAISDCNKLQLKKSFLGMKLIDNDIKRACVGYISFYSPESEETLRLFVFDHSIIEYHDVFFSIKDSTQLAKMMFKDGQ